MTESRTGGSNFSAGGSQKFERKTQDPIHGFIHFSDDTWKIIDTPQFQRLRDIKQLGGACYVYPSATHTRFEHSLGTAFLAQELLDRMLIKDPDILKNFVEMRHKGNLWKICQPVSLNNFANLRRKALPTGSKSNGDYEFTTKIIQIEVEAIEEAIDINAEALRLKRNIIWAALLHDIGHGPFSHVFDKYVTKKVENLGETTHEELAELMIIELAKECNKDLQTPLLTAQDIKFIMDCIDPKDNPKDDLKKFWVYQIVSNKLNSIDVDKFDYFSRDSYHLGLKDTYFDYRTLISECKVIDYQICYPVKQALKINDLFQSRIKLFKTVYTTQSTLAAELMIAEAIIKANSYYKFKDILKEASKYMRLTDNILKEIEEIDLDKIKIEVAEGEIQVEDGENIVIKDLSEAKEIIKKLRTHKLYTAVGQLILPTAFFKKSHLKEYSEAIMALLGASEGMTEDDFILQVVTYGYGTNEGDPYKVVSFFQKDKRDDAVRLAKEEVSILIPERFNEYVFIMYVKDKKNKKEAWDAFSRFCNSKLLEMDEGDRSKYRPTECHSKE